MPLEPMVEMGYALGDRLMRRKPLVGFGRRLPNFSYYAAIEFADLEREQACYDYVARDADPVRSIHVGMNSHGKRSSANFFVSYDV